MSAISSAINRGNRGNPLYTSENTGIFLAIISLAAVAAVAAGVGVGQGAMFHFLATV